MPSNIEFLVLVVSKLPQPFKLEDATIAVWSADKKRFGLSGHEQEHPNHHAVLGMFSGPRGLVGRGWFDRVSSGKYAINENGREEAERIESGRPQTKLLDDSVRKLSAIMDTVAWRRYSQGMIEYLTLERAKEFLKLSCNGFFTSLELATSAKPITLRNGMVLDKKVVKELRACDEAIRFQFGHLLEKK